MSRPISRSRFEQIVGRALDELPREWRREMSHVVIVVEDEPTPDDLAAVGMDPETRDPDLLGLYQGVPQIDRGAGDWDLPDRIVVYRGPTLRAARNRHEVAQIVRETLLHELGHHFGLEEDDLPF